jgi:hypothetical protein
MTAFALDPNTTAGSPRERSILVVGSYYTEPQAHRSNLRDVTALVDQASGIQFQDRVSGRDSPAAGLAVHTSRCLLRHCWWCGMFAIGWFSSRLQILGTG